ncbi:hypothetical protein F3N42_05430 [Marinihelvus fidelis]|uniref:Uncharacterized protein n=2 Tax=Marinihelvus fidelis TaxID=2613842 RepID=A0A5N0THP3_9GAMM|nr:hypothetical protein F3N42_05430 [Marinihelvus fidelis]
MAALLLLSPGLAQAYIGPGLGLGALAVIGGILLSILIAVFALVWYPLKRARARRRARQQDDNAGH